MVGRLDEDVTAAIHGTAGGSAQALEEAVEDEGMLGVGVEAQGNGRRGEGSLERLTSLGAHLGGGEFGPGMGARRNGDKPEVHQRAGHFQRVFRRARAIIHPRKEVAVQVDVAGHGAQRGLSSSSAESGRSRSGSASSERSGTRYSSPSQRPRSSCLQRTEQKGALGFSDRGAAGFRQVGHVLAMDGPSITKIADTTPAPRPGVGAKRERTTP